MREKYIGLFTAVLLISILVSPITVFASNNNLRLGQPNQHVDDIVFKETIKGALKSRSEMNFVLPKGVTFTSLPIVEVSNGNLELDTITDEFKLDGREYIKVKIKSESSIPSTIKIRDIRLTVDRTVPDGPLYLELTGTSISETGSVFPGEDAMQIQLGEVVEVSTDMHVVFKIGSQVYYQGSNAKVMDAVPYLKGNRTFVPLRFLVNTLGITDKDIAFDNGKVTINRGSNLIELSVGKNEVIVNGESYTTDVAPEVQDGRIMLPTRAVAEILGAKVDFVEDQIIITTTN